MTALIVPLLLFSVAAWCAYKGVDFFSAMVKGAKDGLSTVSHIFPSLVVMLTAIYMLRISGALDFLARIAAPALNFLGIPSEAAPLLFLRPFSGSGALALGTELMQHFGADSTLGRTVAVMLGSTETTFYVIAVYFGAAGIKKTRHAVPSALMADLVGFMVAALSVRLFF